MIRIRGRILKGGHRVVERYFDPISLSVEGGDPREINWPLIDPLLKMAVNSIVEFIS